MKKVMSLYKASLKELSITRNVVFCGLMAALAIVLGMVATISIGQYLRIGFSGLPNRLVDYLFGPVAGCLFGGALDILKYFLKPTGPYFFGFTLNAMLSGLIYGSILYGKTLSLKRVIASELLVKLLVNCILGTFWLSMLYGNAFMVLFPARLLKNVITLPVDCAVLYVTLRYIGQTAKRFGFIKHNMVV